MTNEPEWVERLEKKIEENYFVTPSSHLNVDGLKLFIKEEKEKSYQDGRREGRSDPELFDEQYLTVTEKKKKKAKSELLSKIEEEVDEIKTQIFVAETLKDVKSILSKYKRNIEMTMNNSKEDGTIVAKNSSKKLTRLRNKDTQVCHK